MGGFYTVAGELHNPACEGTLDGRWKFTANRAIIGTWQPLARSGQNQIARIDWLATEGAKPHGLHQAWLTPGMTYTGYGLHQRRRRKVNDD